MATHSKATSVSSRGILLRKLIIQEHKYLFTATFILRSKPRLTSTMYNANIFTSTYSWLHSSRETEKNTKMHKCKVNKTI